MNYGFVYVLSNLAMPGLYKIGRTERHPRHRVAELDSKTALPHDFDLLCYLDVDDSVAAEYHFHRAFAEQRVNPSREFFRLDIAHLAFEISFYCHEGNGQLVDTGGLEPDLYAAYELSLSDVRRAWEVDGLRERVMQKPAARLSIVGGAGA